MTYCIAWKYKGKPCMISDSAMSYKEIDNVDKRVGTFGKEDGRYNDYFVQEGESKIIKLNGNVAVSYSGNTDIVKEAIENMEIRLSFGNNIQECLGVLESTYNSNEFELLIICNDENNEGKIYYFDGEKCREIEEYKEIGSGIEQENFSENIVESIKEQCTKENDIAEHIVKIISYTQWLLLDGKSLDNGVGGIIFGVYLDEEIKWCKDLFYYVFDNSIDDYKTIFLLCRYNLLFVYSDYNKQARIYYNNIKTDKNILENKYKLESVLKLMYTNLFDFIIFFDIKRNAIYCQQTNKWHHNTNFRMWIKRQYKETKYAFGFSNMLIDFIKMAEGYTYISPKTAILRASDTYFEPRKNFKDTLCNSELLDEYDYDLRSFEVDFDYSKKYFEENIDKNINNFYNIVIIDFKYLYYNIKRIYSIYKLDRIELDNINFKIIVTQFMSGVASDRFEEYGFYFVKEKDDEEKIDDFSLSDLIKSYSNFTIIEVEKNKKYELAGIIFNVIKNYYFNEKYFCIDKLLFMCDDECVSKVLYYAPKVTTKLWNRSLDIFLVKNRRGSCIDSGFEYMRIDYVVGYMLGLEHYQFELM